MMRRWGRILMWGVFGAFLVAGFYAGMEGEKALTAQGAPPIAKVIFIQGTVQVQRAGTTQWVPATVGMELAEQDQVRTGGVSLVEIAFDEKGKNVVKLSQEGQLMIEKLAPHRLNLPKGELLSLIKRLPRRSTFEVRTPTAVVGVRGTGWSTQTDGQATSASSFENTIFGQGIDPQGNVTGEVEIPEGLKTSFDEFGQIGALEQITEQEFDRWSEWKEEVGEHVQEQEQAPAGEAADQAPQASPTEQAAQQVIEQVEQQVETLQESQQTLFESLEEKKIEERQTTPPGGGSTSSSSSSSSG